MMNGFPGRGSEKWSFTDLPPYYLLLLLSTTTTRVERAHCQRQELWISALLSDVKKFGHIIADKDKNIKVC